MHYRYQEGFHAAIDYLTVKRAGPPCRPIEFPSPTVELATRKCIRALDHRTGKVCQVRNVLMRARGPQQAFLLRKKISKTVYGVVRQGVLLRRVTNADEELLKNADFENGDERIEWVSTERLVVVKASSWSRMRQLRGRHLEDPIREISAMQLVGDYHPNIIGAIDILQDEDSLYTVMPYCSGGDLFGRIVPEETNVVSEARARAWFRQLLAGLFHLQRKGVCHRDLCLENLLLDEKDNLVIIDLGMSLRVPYTDSVNIGCVTDASEGTERRLMVAQGQGGRLMYLAPEQVTREEAFDGFTIDLWAAGVILFIMLVGMAPFKWAHESDSRYSQIASGGLKALLREQNITLSEEACDLLQHMFREDPTKRFTLAQVMRHPWVMDKKFIAPNIPLPKKSVPVQHSKNTPFQQYFRHRGVTPA